jgi:hypothetical protein
MYEAILALNKAAIDAKDMISITKTIQFTDTNKVNHEGTLRLTVGRGYFSGSVLEIETHEPDPLNVMIDRPIEINAQRFIDNNPPGPNDPWIL